MWPCVTTRAPGAWRRSPSPSPARIRPRSSWVMRQWSLWWKLASCPTSIPRAITISRAVCHLLTASWKPRTMIRWTAGRMRWSSPSTRRRVGRSLPPLPSASWISVSRRPSASSSRMKTGVPMPISRSCRGSTARSISIRRPASISTSWTTAVTRPMP